MRVEYAKLKEVEVGAIDAECEDFCVGEELCTDRLEDSLRAVGQLNPVILLERGARLVIVCGFRRVAAMRRLGAQTVVARILTAEDCRVMHPFELALRDNLSQRKPSPLEQSRTVVKLRDLCGITRERLIGEYLPLLGLPPHGNALDGCLALHAARPELKRLFAEGTITFASMERLANLSENEQERFASLMSVVRLSASLQKKTLDLLNDLAGMNQSPITDPLDIPEIQEFLRNGKLSSFQKGERLYEALYSLRNPRLARAVADFAVQRKLLGLPGAVRVTPPQYFETVGLRVEFDATTPEKFRQLVAALQKAAESPVLEKLFF